MGGTPEDLLTIDLTGHDLIIWAPNVDKRRITMEDFVMVRYQDDVVEYLGDNKPSVDIPIQAKLYANTSINYMIHGHTYIKGYPFTEHYYPCGDLREFYEVIKQLTAQTGCINLKNHGFLLFASTIEGLEELVNSITLIEREVGYEEVHSI